MISKFFKGMTVNHISQIFHEGHKGWDIASSYGTPLCAPEDLKIEKIVGDTFTPHDTKNLKRGYGVWGKGLETGCVYVFWHTLPYLPVTVGNIAKRGQIIAYMGNAGQVYSGGVYVPLEERTVAPYKGTHLHVQIYEPSHPMGFIKGGEIDPMTMVDFSLEPDYTVLDQLKSAAVALKKMIL